MEYTMVKTSGKLLVPREYLDSSGRNDMPLPLYEGFSTKAP